MYSGILMQRRDKGLPNWCVRYNEIPLFYCEAWFSYDADAPATWPLVLPGVLFRNENRSGRQHWSSQSWEVRSWLKFNFAGMPVVKLCDGSRCHRRTFSFVREVAQVVPAATSQIHRRHIRARLYWGKNWLFVLPTSSLDRAFIVFLRN